MESELLMPICQVLLKHNYRPEYLNWPEKLWKHQAEYAAVLDINSFRMMFSISDCSDTLI